jgi:hypothetical protein
MPTQGHKRGDIVVLTRRHGKGVPRSAGLALTARGNSVSEREGRMLHDVDPSQAHVVISRRTTNAKPDKEADQ